MKKTNIEVHARIRPLNQKDGHFDPSSLRLEDGTSIIVDNEKGSEYTYRLNQCYGPDTRQDDVFSHIMPMAERVLSGTNASIFCYGVTGSGKTHTMQGSERDPGIIPRTIETLFERAEEMVDRQITLAFAYVEILKDQVYDLQVGAPDSGAGSSRRWSQSFKAPTVRPKLDLRMDAKGNTVIAGMQRTEISSPEEFHTLFNKAAANRKTASTNLNHGSSRSHAILTIYVRTVWEDGSAQESKICLTDLAGSENNNLTGNDPERMKESAAINKSLSTLRIVVEAINKNAMRIPYRDSKLTRILADALGGTSKGLLICCLAPGAKFTKDTINTMEFASRSKEVQNSAIVNERTARRQSAAPALGRPASSMGAARLSMAGPTRPRPASSLGLSPVRPNVPANRTSLLPPASYATGPLSIAGGARNMPLSGRANVLGQSTASNSSVMAISGPAARRATSGYAGATAASRNKENVPNITITEDKGKSHPIDEAFTKNGGLTMEQARAVFDQMREEEDIREQLDDRRGIYIEHMTQEERTSRRRKLVSRTRRLQAEGDFRGALKACHSAMWYDPQNDKLRIHTLELEETVKAMDQPKPPPTDVFGDITTGIKRARHHLEVLDEASEMLSKGSSTLNDRERKLPPPKRRMLSQSTSLRI